MLSTFAIETYVDNMDAAEEIDRIRSIAIDRTIDSIPDDFVIKPYLVVHRAEVKGMLLTEYNEAETMELFKEEGMNLVSALIQKLLDLGRTEDVARVTSDPAYRDKLIAEFKLA